MADNNNPNIQIICRQTTYTEEEAKEKLELCSNDVSLVIKQYLGVQEKPKVKTSINQQIYSQLRTFMNDVNEQYENRKEKQQN